LALDPLIYSYYFAKQLVLFPDHSDFLNSKYDNYKTEANGYFQSKYDNKHKVAQNEFWSQVHGILVENSKPNKAPGEKHPMVSYHLNQR